MSRYAIVEYNGCKQNTQMYLDAEHTPMTSSKPPLGEKSWLQFPMSPCIDAYTVC